ncbi:MAG: hypothetical protein HOP19_21685, partial [Acidobacteria bacterium]|nr:hypothetical protein [Acidobacteriota bacterium]
DAYCTRGVMRLRQGHAPEAQQDFDQCLQLNPRLRQSLEEMIKEARQPMTAIRGLR